MTDTCNISTPMLAEYAELINTFTNLYCTIFSEINDYDYDYDTCSTSINLII
jgi:hypothetical protein